MFREMRVIQRSRKRRAATPVKVRPRPRLGRDVSWPFLKRMLEGSKIVKNLDADSEL
jgi:hypothetical protein